MKTITIICDHCEKEIKPSLNQKGFYLSLRAIEYSESPGGFLHPVMVYPPIDSNKDFCSTLCVKDFFS